MQVLTQASELIMELTLVIVVKILTGCNRLFKSTLRTVHPIRLTMQTITPLPSLMRPVREMLGWTIFLLDTLTLKKPTCNTRLTKRPVECIVYTHLQRPTLITRPFKSFQSDLCQLQSLNYSLTCWINRLTQTDLHASCPKDLIQVDKADRLGLSQGNLMFAAKSLRTWL